MYARVTQFDIDTVQISIEKGLERFRELVLPALREQQGYQGVMLLHTGEGRGLLVTLWTSDEAALAGESSGYYAEQIAKFVTFYRQPPGREHFHVGFLETLAPTVT